MYYNIKRNFNINVILEKSNMKKGSLCSINGGNYEKKILYILNKTMLNNKQFNTQTENELGGSTLCNDLLCNYNSNKDIGI